VREDETQIHVKARAGGFSREDEIHTNFSSPESRRAPFINNSIFQRI
jgi:hypothetical protein